jgi:hypothetical protein
VPVATAPSAQALQRINDFEGLINYLRDELDWEIPELPQSKLTYSYTADELGLKSDAKVDIQQLRPILGQSDPWGVFFIDFDKADLPVTLLRRLLAGVSRKQRESANPATRKAFEKNDLLFISAFGKADSRRIALAHFHQESEGPAIPTLRVIGWDRADTPRHMTTVAERMQRLRWPDDAEHVVEARARWASAFVSAPRSGITTAKALASALAETAKTIRVAITEILPLEKPGQPLPQLFEAVKATLNKDLDVAKFADTYAQTLAYGLLAKRMDQVQRWKAEKARTLDGTLPLPLITLEALETALPTNPFLSELLGSFLTAVGRDGAEAGRARLNFDVLGTGDLVSLLNTAQVEDVLDDFDKDKAGDDPVIHFYEGFLAAYDKAMKVQRGVFYTPKPVVGFIVRSVDEVLRTEFGLTHGLADTTTWGQFVASHPEAKIPDGIGPDEPFVKILDPATGTGTFLVEVIDLIWRRLTEEVWAGKSKAEKARLWNAWVPQHLLPRLYGYELMMAPYAVAHMKIGLKLADTGYDFSGVDADGRPARARVFLTNALQPPQDLDMQLAFMNEALAHEARAANAAKASNFTAVLGNPPYSGISANMQPWAQALVDRFRYIGTTPLGEKKSWLQNDYVKFFSFAMGEIENTRSGVVSLVTDNSYLDGPTFRGMRYQQAIQWASARVLDLGGKSTINQGDRDENVFEIQQGVSVLTISRGQSEPTGINVGVLRGLEIAKLTKLRDSHVDDLTPRTGYPRADQYDFFEVPVTNTETEYRQYPSISSIFLESSVGVQTSRDHLAVGFSKKELTRTIETFCDQRVSDAKARSEWFPPAKDDAKYLAGDTRGWQLSTARRLLRADSSWKRAIVPIAYRPLDERYFGATELISDWPREELGQAMSIDGNVCLNVVRRTENRRAYDYVLASASIPSNHFVSLKDGSYGLPLWRVSAGSALGVDPNLSSASTSRLAALTGLHFDDSVDGSAQPRLSGVKRPRPAQGAQGVRRERGDLRAAFGPRDVFDWIYAVLHSPEYRMRYADFLKSEFARVPLPKDRALFAALVPLGTKLVALHLLDAEGAPALEEPKVKFSAGKGEARLGRFGKEVHRDAAGRVYINGDHWFATVPQGAWEHWIGGYQPAQKWLKDRSQTGTAAKLKPGRVLSEDDILHYRRMIVALTETAKIQAEIDKVIARHGGWPAAFQGLAA